MEIKSGYNEKPLKIRIQVSRKEDRAAELWLMQGGLELPPHLEKYKETLSYITLQELLDLRDEVATAIKEITL